MLAGLDISKAAKKAILLRRKQLAVAAELLILSGVLLQSVLWLHLDTCFGKCYLTQSGCNSLALLNSSGRNQGSRNKKHLASLRCGGNSLALMVVAATTRFGV